MRILLKFLPVIFTTILAGVSCKETPLAGEACTHPAHGFIPIDTLASDIEMSTKKLEEQALELEKALELL